MFSNIGELVSNITQSISDFFNPKDPGSNLYPKSEAITKVLSQIDSKNWQENLGYAFGVRDITQLGGGAVGGFADFQLPINPSELNQDETFSIIVRPTQGGTVTQHSGNRYQDITISGTTGVHPFRGAGGANDSGQAIFQPTDLKHQSGFYVFQQLRNWFRAYYEFKKINKDSAKNLRLIFQNFKDGEFLMVELLRFSMKRSADRPKLYNYNLVLRVIGRIKQDASKKTFIVDQILNDTFNALDTARGVFLRSQDILTQVEENVENTVVEPLRRVNLALKALLGIRTVASDLSNQFIHDFVTAGVAFAVLTHIKDDQDQAKQGSNTSGSSSSQIPNITSAAVQKGSGSGVGAIGSGVSSSGFPSDFENVVLPPNLSNTANANPAGAVLGLKDALMKVPINLFPQEAINKLNQDQRDATQLSRSYYENLITTLKAVRDNACDKFNLSSTSYNTHFRRTVTVSIDPTKTVTDDEFEVLGALNLSISALYNLLRTQILFDATYAERIDAMKSQFSDPPPLQTTLAVREVIMPTNTTLERLALNELGDSSRWPELAELNNLKPPYVVQDKTDPSEDVLHPGDSVLIPAPIVNGFSDTLTLKTLPINQDLTETEKALAIDLKATSNWDLELTNMNDLQLTSGAKNAAQAILLKLFYEKGDLLKHPEVGVGIEVGTKGNPVSQLKTDIINSLTVDPRFSSIQNLILKRTNSTLQIQFTLYVKNFDMPIPVDFNFPLAA